MSKLHDLDWQNIRNTLVRLNCPTKIDEIGVTLDEMIEAINIAPTIRPVRNTILNKIELDRENIKTLLSETKCI